jgi:RimJ/RimL family protein N-acetyltransferase
VGITTPPYRVETERLVIRCWEPRDAPLLKSAVDSSLEHLRPWMPWAYDEPQTLPEKIELLRGFRGRFDLGEDYVYGIFSPRETEVLGGSGLHTRVGADAFEIGYWVTAAAAGRGYATETTAALTRVGIELAGADRIEIRVDPANEASMKVPRKVGFTEEATLRRRLPGRRPGDEARDSVIFSLLREDLPSSPAAAVSYTAYDAASRLVVPDAAAPFGG